MTHTLTHLIVTHGYLAVFVLMVLESACIPVPSEVVMLFGGALAAGVLAGSGSAHVGVVGVALAGTVGNVVGALIAYAVGRAGGRPLLERHGRRVLLRTEHIDRAERFFQRRGDLAVLVGRVLPVVRTFISLPAGVARMPLGRFVAYTAIGSLPWTFALAGLGYAVASSWDQIASGFTIVSIVVVALIVAAVVYLVVRRRRLQPSSPG